MISAQATEPIGSGTYEQTKVRAVAGGKAFFLRYLAVGVLSLAGSTFLIRSLGPPAWASFSIAYYLVVFLDQTFAPKLLGRLLQAAERPSAADVDAASRLMHWAGLACALLLAAASYPAGRLYGDPGLTYCLLAVGGCAYVYAIRSASVALLERELAYRRIAIADIVDQLTFYALAVPLVLLDYGLSGVAVALALRGVLAAGLLRRWAPTPFVATGGQRELRTLLAFGLPSTVASLVFLCDGLVPVVVLGGDHAEELAFTMTAVTIVGYAATAQVVVQRVGFPSLAMLQLEPERFRKALERTIRLGNFVIVSSVVPVAASSPLWLPTLLGAEWRPAALVMMAIGGGLIINGFHSVISPALSALGRPGWVLRLQLLMTGAYLALALVLTPHWHLLGPAVAWAVSRAIGAGASIAALAATKQPTPWIRQTFLSLGSVGAMGLVGWLLYARQTTGGALLGAALATIWLASNMANLRTVGAAARGATPLESTR